ncbi:hypothetical protein LEAN103870_00950 [Legionella anisa]|uniref:Uncharacterized protein n=1 Tax=Legionella anisa TaxID=28082 RepID=A0AAX0WZC8_9GAMM|nr:hypothetical protein [Legionella anisa]AWN73856.1 hypothetical protein DLD14_08410 [Legionella anisa]KTC67115.1 hypothetical protein Lani_3460 [Legionella anisa]MBN5936300.1 hypothetical protein [Legionella anisa]MCW8426111.1 hypothetical protein [Legionella anisa]MCW8448422.1 hypothetical protein [Legionella anisa]
MEDMNSHLSSAIPLTMELSKKMFLDFAYIHPQEFGEIRTPYELMEKQMNVLLRNNLNYMNYMSQLFSVWFYLPNKTEGKIKKLAGKVSKKSHTLATKSNGFSRKKHAKTAHHKSHAVH